MPRRRRTATCSVTDCGASGSPQRLFQCQHWIHLTCWHAMQTHALRMVCPLCRQPPLVQHPPLEPPLEPNLHQPIPIPPHVHENPKLDVRLLAFAFLILLGLTIGHWSGTPVFNNMCQSPIEHRILNSSYTISYWLNPGSCLPTTNTTVINRRYPRCPHLKTDRQFDYESESLTLVSTSELKEYCELPQSKCILYATHMACVGYCDTSICPHRSGYWKDTIEMGFFPIGSTPTESRRWIPVTVYGDILRGSQLPKLFAQASYWCSDADAWYRDELIELPYNGTTLLLRVLACIAVLVVLWISYCIQNMHHDR
jgi:hypothetical protein